MKTHTNTFKENIKSLGRQKTSKITYELDEETIELGDQELNSITPSYKSNILKSTMKQLDIDSNVEIPLGTELNYQFGLKVNEDISGDPIYEYLNYGNYMVYKAEKQEDTKSWLITCYDKMLYAMKDYESLQVEYPITIRSYINALCTKIGLVFKNVNDTFANYDREIQKELFLDEEGNSLEYTYRDVLDQLAEVTGSIICIDEETDELEIRYINDTLTDVNLLDVSTIEQKTENGITCTYDSNNQTITFNGTCTDETYFEFTDTYTAVKKGARLYLPYFTAYYVDGNTSGTGYCYLSTGSEAFDLSELNDENPIITLSHKTAGQKYTGITFYDGDVADNYKIRVFVSNEVHEEYPLRDTIDEEYLKNINVNFGEVYGPVNSIVLSRAAGGDNVYLQDDESIALNGLCEIKIFDNQFMNFNDRSDYLPDLLDVLDGFGYTVNNFDSTGIMYYQLGDKYNVKVGDNEYTCIMFNDEAKITQGLVESIYTELPEASETPYSKADKTDRRINQTYIIADKQKGEIEILTSRTTSLEDATGRMYDIDQVNQLIQDAETGVTNTFAEAGGNNIFRNTGLWFETTDSNNPYEFWTGLVERTKEENASNMNAILLQDNTVSQEQIVANGNYTVSFKYKKLINLAEASVFINDVEYELTATTDTEFIEVFEVASQHINITFDCSIANGVEIYDLMVNAGNVKLAYSQNQNETTTDTVNISKGITITSTDTETTFKANADGIRTLDKRGNVLTQFTDTGMTTKEMIVQDESQIVGILVQPVGDQTWFTKL